jgi:RNA polymerase sigma-70 factor (ECF subfamily)
MAQGDETALRELYDQTYARLWDFARALGGAREEADEVVQDAYTLLWERAVTWDAQSHVRGFLYVTVKNLVRNATRRLRTATAGETQHAPEIVAGSMAADPASPDLDAEYRELVRAVLQAIAELPNPRRMALVLRWREQLPYEEIARVLGTSPAVARQLVTRARGMLRARIGHLFEE